MPGPATFSQSTVGERWNTQGFRTGEGPRYGLLAAPGNLAETGAGEYAVGKAMVDLTL